MSELKEWQKGGPLVDVLYNLVLDLHHGTSHEKEAGNRLGNAIQLLGNPLFFNGIELDAGQMHIFSHILRQENITSLEITRWIYDVAKIQEQVSSHQISIKPDPVVRGFAQKIQ